MAQIGTVRSRKAVGALAIALGLGGVMMSAPAQAVTHTVSTSPKAVACATPNRASATPAVDGLLEIEGDYVHISSTPPATASAHGWWVNVEGPATAAVVTVRLQAEQGVCGTWVTYGSPAVGTVASGGGSGNRVTARFSCVGSGAVTWRSEVTAAPVGYTYTATTLYTTPQTIDCTP